MSNNIQIVKIIPPDDVRIYSADILDPSDWVIQAWVWKNLDVEKNYMVQTTRDGIKWQNFRDVSGKSPWIESVPMIPIVEHPRLVEYTITSVA